MHLAALVKSLDHVCCRYRLAGFRAHFERAGHRLTLHPWPAGWWSAWRQRAAPIACDVLIVQRRLLSGRQLRQVRRAARYLVYDFDDAVFLRDSYAWRGPHSARRLRGFRRMVAAADAVVAGNDFLRAQATPWTAAERVHLIPTCVDAARYTTALHRRAGPQSRIVWIGSSSTLRSLEQIRPLLESFGDLGCSLKVICDRPFALRKMTVLNRPWAEDTEAAELADADVGISWLPDDLWSRGKCGLKVLQYMAAGLPVVANPVGMQADLVVHGETGFLATSADQWRDALRLLAGNPALRRRLGHAGRRLVEDRYGIDRAATQWLHLLEGLSPAKTKAVPA